ncbi:albumin-like [Phascolarctos cinereus]
MYAEMADCCAKEEPERNRCFLNHKDDHPDLPEIIDPEAEVQCQAIQENENKLLKSDHMVVFANFSYIYEVSRRRPYFYAPELLVYAHQYKEAVKECCQGIDKATCLQEELIGRLSQKFPKIEFAELHKIVDDLANVHKECCHGDLLECADDRVALSEYVCNHKDAISSKLRKCCDKPVIQKSQCIADLENDDIPADLPNFLAEYVETKDACKNYQEAKDVYLAHYLYDSGRRHPELAVTTLLRLTKDYEHTLEECCATADPPACLCQSEH